MPNKTIYPRAYWTRILVISLTIFTSIFAMTFSYKLSAATQQIISYDIHQTPVCGFGCWINNDTGTAANIDHTCGGSGICDDRVGHALNYSIGTKILNNGVFEITHLKPLEKYLGQKAIKNSLSLQSVGVA